MQMTACINKQRLRGQWLRRTCPNASNKTLHEKSQPCSQQAMNKPVAIRGSRTRQQQTASSSNTDSKRRLNSSRRPGGRVQAAKTLLPRVEGVSTATTLCSSYLLPSVEETARRSQSSKPPPAASVPKLQVCQAAYQTKRRLKTCEARRRLVHRSHYV